MTATIIAFPIGLRRDDHDFEHKGRSSLTDCLDLAWSIKRTGPCPAKAAVLAPRLVALADGVSRLANYRGELDLFPLEEGWLIELAELPALFLKMAGLSLPEARALSAGAEICPWPTVPIAA